VARSFNQTTENQFEQKVAKEAKGGVQEQVQVRHLHMHLHFNLHSSQPPRERLPIREICGSNF